MYNELNKINCCVPDYYHRDYVNDIDPCSGARSRSDQTNLERLKRVTTVALPFITLYKPLSFPISLGLGAMRTVSCFSLLTSFASSEKDFLTKSYLILQAVISMVSLEGTVFAHPIGMLLTTGQDLIIDVANLAQYAKKGDYKLALESCMNILNNGLYLSLFFYGGLEISIASLGMQILCEVYRGQIEFSQGRYLEGVGHIAMAAIRGKQMMEQVQTLQTKRKTLEDLEELMDALIKYGNNPERLPALHAAIKAKDEKTVRLFLDHGADPNAQVNGWDSSALECAAEFGNVSLINLLIDRGAAVTASPLWIAAAANNAENIRCLVKRGADMYWTSCMTPSIFAGGEIAIKTLVECGYNLNKAITFRQFEDGPFLPLKSAIYGSDEKFELLLQLGADPNFIMPTGESILHRTEAVGRPGPPESSKVEIFIRYGGNINLRDQDGKTPLYYAKKWFGKYGIEKEFMDCLVAHGATE